MNLSEIECESGVMTHMGYAARCYADRAEKKMISLLYLNHTASAIQTDVWSLYSQVSKKISDDGRHD